MLPILLASVSLEIVFTALYLASLLLCLRWLIFSDNSRTVREHIDWPLLTITIILFALYVTDVSLTLRELYRLHWASSHNVTIPNDARLNGSVVVRTNS